MNVKQVLKQLKFSPDDKEIRDLNRETKIIISDVKSEIKKKKIKAEVFVGGSLAKGTLTKSNKYDVDIFIRFDEKYENLSEILEKIIKTRFKNRDVERMHGSRDYFRIKSSSNVVFEIIPVLKLKNRKNAKNVTDLSYYHVRYVKSKIKNKNIAEQICAAKTFCRAQGVYGAESYIQGFSGYGIECLLIQYKTFENFLKNVLKSKEKIMLDPEKHYKNKHEIVIHLNESKTKSPIVLVDPTFKERNVLASLNEESYNKFKQAASDFLKNPSVDFFKIKDIDVNSLKNDANKLNSELLIVELTTDKQKGDIAGTKLKKVAKFLGDEILSKFFVVERKEFDYDERQTAKAYYIVKSKGKQLKKGPPTEQHFKKFADEFRKANKNVFEKDGNLWCEINSPNNAKQYLLDYYKNNLNVFKQMDVTGLRVM